MAKNISPEIMECVYKLLTGNNPYYNRAKYGRIFSYYRHDGLQAVLRRMITKGHDGYSTMDFLIGNIKGNINQERVVLITDKRDERAKMALGAIQSFYDTFGDNGYYNHKLLPQYAGLLAFLKEHIGEITGNRIVAALDTVVSGDVRVLTRFI